METFQQDPSVPGQDTNGGTFSTAVLISFIVPGISYDDKTLNLLSDTLLLVFERNFHGRVRKPEIDQSDRENVNQVLTMLRFIRKWSAKRANDFSEMMVMWVPEAAPDPKPIAAVELD
ncbi:hypothetical protein AVEN_275424-1 [Araneus ventricosus]|uniref:Uncharacterized protein n=1 Tax=Araneus ventricosus TaxID=182803 RepID=A0A4Y2LAG9_ARAVE|nr:hypothetical protein AVEN_275424-1 [Araneus ventricosus]